MTVEEIVALSFLAYILLPVVAYLVYLAWGPLKRLLARPKGPKTKA